MNNGCEKDVVDFIKIMSNNIMYKLKKTSIASTERSIENSEIPKYHTFSIKH